MKKILFCFKNSISPFEGENDKSPGRKMYLIIMNIVMFNQTYINKNEHKMNNRDKKLQNR